MAEGDVADKIDTLRDFGAGVDNLGFDYYAPLHLQSSPNWKIRMSTAWCLIGEAQRDLARGTGRCPPKADRLGATDALTLASVTVRGARMY